MIRDEQPYAEIDSEEIDFRVASEFFAVIEMTGQKYGDNPVARTSAELSTEQMRSRYSTIIEEGGSRV